jgi:serine protease Do
MNPALSTLTQSRAARTVLAALALGLGATSLAPSQAQTLAPEVIDRIMKSTALIYILDAKGQIDGSGSGNLVSAQGYVLTNYHVVGDLKTRKYYPALAVGFAEFQDREPEMKYLADVVVADPNLDLAIIKLSKDLKGKPLPANTVFGEPVQIGDSNKLRLGEPVFLFGFPGVGGYTITFSTGIVGGFVAQDGQSSGRDWIKHSANSGPGNSGGGLYNAQGQLIGIHTRGVSDTESAARQPLARPVALGLGLLVPNVPDLRVGPGQDRTTLTPPPSPQATVPAPTPPAGVNLAWPLRPSVGQSWNISINGVGSWSVSLSELDKDGDPKGRASGLDARTAFFYYVQKEDLTYIDLIGNDFVYCGFSAAGIKGGTVTGLAYRQQLQNGNAVGDAQKIGTCTATLNTSGSSTSVTPTSTSTTTTSTTSTSTTRTVALAWPPTKTLTQGLAWTVSIQGGQTYTGTITAKDSDGDWTGQGSGSSLFTFALSEGGFVFQVLEKSTGGSYICVLDDASTIVGSQFNGRAFFLKNKDASPQELNKTCTVTLSR